MSILPLDVAATNPIDVTLDNLVPLSASALWHRQTDFYQSFDIQAWDSRVPFYATCNPYIANAYANAIVRYLQETLRDARPDSPPCHIVELGAGHGIFTFYLLRRILELSQSLHLDRLPFVYVATDCVPGNLAFWKAHPQFQPFIAAGKLDFALFDALTDTQLSLQVSGRVLSAEEQDGASAPMVLVANYLFDSLPQDLFRVVDGVAEEGLVPAAPTIPDGLPDNAGLSLTQSGCPVTYRPLSSQARYDDPELDQILATALQRGSEHHVLMPVAALRAVRTLSRIAGERMLLIATDKSYGADTLAAMQAEPGLAFHATAFSMMVDFDLLGMFFQQRGGDCFQQSTNKEIGTAAFVCGARFDALVETRHALEHFLDRFSPGDLFGLYAHLQQVQAGTSLNVLVSYLNMTGWDPHVFDSHIQHIYAILDHSDLFAIQDLVRGLPLMAANYYELNAHSHFFEHLGVLCQRLKLFAQAITYYQQALQRQPDMPSLHYNLGLCHCALNDTAQARHCFNSAIALKPDYIAARGWLQLIDSDAVVAQDVT